jgi:hypothetical protein
MKSRKPLAIDWVFGGSLFFPDPEDAKKPKLYAANGGDLICVSNFETAMLDLPVPSTQLDGDLQYEAFTERIPPLGTKVTVILAPRGFFPAPRPRLRRLLLAAKQID